MKEAELDEQWSYVGNKSNQRWLWYAVDHASNTVLAYTFGKRQDTVFEELKTLLEPLGIRRYYTDDWGAYERHLEADKHEMGKQNTQKIERKNLNWRTWNEQPRRKQRGIRTLRAVCHHVVSYILFLDFERTSLSCPHHHAFPLSKQNSHHSKTHRPIAAF